MTGAPAKPFAFDADPSVPEELTALPEETENVRIEDVEFFTAEDGSDAVRFYFRFLGDPDPYFFTALQDGIEMPIIFEGLDLDQSLEEAEKAGDTGTAENADDVSKYACKLRTHSPVVFLVFEDKFDGTKVFEAAKTVEIK